MDIKFVSYNGKYPNLCSGILILSIDGKETTFGPKFLGTDYDAFWSSGGCVVMDDEYNAYTSTGLWELEESYLPEFLKDHGQELIDLFNDNVEEYGCCGGCI